MDNSSRRLRGRVAVITGGGRGVGRSYARLLAEEGARVVVNDLGDADGKSEAANSVVAEIEQAGGEAVANGDDIADWAGGERLISQAIDVFGRLDLLICNAGILRDRTLAQMSESEWDDIMRVHLRGTFVPLRHAAAHWRQESKETGQPTGGRVILTTSEAGLYGNASQTNYAAAKAGIASLSVASARELRRYGVTVNAIAPRARTRLTEGTFGDLGGNEGFDYWDPDNVAPWIVYLCGPDGGRISGQTFVVGGGRIELMTGWDRVNVVEKKGRWALDELPAASAELFGDRKTVPPRFPDMGLPPSISMRTEPER
jgi:NAD(P)-dependent dehydrogenase (short-subunit alcohol dehydrogenase family)